MRLIEVNVWSNGDNTMEVDLKMTSTAWEYRLQQSVRDHRQYLVAMLNMEPIGSFSKALSLVQISQVVDYPTLFINESELYDAINKTHIIEITSEYKRTHVQVLPSCCANAL